MSSAKPKRGCSMHRLLVLVAGTVLILGTAPNATATSRHQVAICKEHHPWQHVGQRAHLIWCIANRLNAPGRPSYAVAIGHCESGSDLQDLYGGDGYVGTFQHITDSYPGRWRRWGRPWGVPSGDTNVLGQAVVSVNMAKAIGGWGAPGGWSCA